MGKNSLSNEFPSKKVFKKMSVHVTDFYHHRTVIRNVRCYSVQYLASNGAAHPYLYNGVIRLHGEDYNVVVRMSEDGVETELALESNDYRNVFSLKPFSQLKRKVWK